MTWYQLYVKEIEKKGGIRKYFKLKINTKKNFIKLIQKYSSNKTIAELGSGTSIISTYMAGLGYKVTAIDEDEKMLSLATKIAKECNYGNQPAFIQGSILDLDYINNHFDVCFSNGVLEHFTDEDIIKIIQKQLQMCEVVIFGIPTKYFNREEAMYGDERYLGLKYWRQLIYNANGIILEEKSCHYMPWLQRLFNFKKYFRPYPYRIFVIKKK